LRTTISISDELMDALVSCTRTKSKSKAIEIAIREYIDNKSIEGLLALSGRVEIDLDWQKEEDIELDEYRDHR